MAIAAAAMASESLEPATDLPRGAMVCLPCGVSWLRFWAGSCWCCGQPGITTIRAVAQLRGAARAEEHHMPGMLTVDQQDTFATPPIVTAVYPKMKYKASQSDPDEQEVNRATGEPKWIVQAAVTYRPQFEGMTRVDTQVIEVTVTGMQPDVAGPVQFTRLQAGVSAPEQRERRNGGGQYVTGGKLWWSAAGVESVSASNGRATASASAA